MTTIYFSIEDNLLRMKGCDRIAKLEMTTLAGFTCV